MAEDYSDFRNISSTQKLNKPPTQKAMFSIQHPQKHGFGPYHFNRFLRWFKVTSISGQTFSDNECEAISQQLTFWLYTRFESTFSASNIASVNKGLGDRAELDGRPTREFHIGGNKGAPDHKILGAIHPDWIAMDTAVVSATSLNSFSGQTIKREFENKFETSSKSFLKDMDSVFKNSLKSKDEYWKKLFKIVDVIPNLRSLIGVNYFILMMLRYMSFDEFLTLNRYHFLSGRRSWRIGYDKVLKYFYFETLAIERFSHLIWELSDNFIANKLVHDLRNDIIELWMNHADASVLILAGEAFDQFKIGDAFLQPARKAGFEYGSDHPYCQFFQSQIKPENLFSALTINKEHSPYGTIKDHLFILDLLKSIQIAKPKPK